MGFVELFMLITGIIGAATAVGGAVAGGMAEGSRRKAQTEANAAEAKANKQNQLELERSAKLEEANAVDSLVRGSLLAGRKRMETTGTLWSQYVGFANSGVDATVGTPTQVAASSALFGELDALTIENNAAREAWGHKETARKYRLGQKQLSDEMATARIRDRYEAEANTYRDIGMGLNTAGSLLGTAGSIAGAWKPKGAS